MNPNSESKFTHYLLIVGITGLHAMFWLLHYSETPLGLSPALDNRQTLELARSMATGELAQEPFHRAPLYPYLLSLPLRVGFDYNYLPLFARLTNLLALACITLCASQIALRLWKSNVALWTSGLLVGLNPVLLFFAGDAFDILPATAIFCIALVQLQAWHSHPSAKRALYIGLLLALATALRSHFLPLAIAWPCVALARSRTHRIRNSLLSCIGPALGFILLGIANLQVAGEFRMMPWQGAYNLWAGNGPEANGRIYAQRIHVQFDKGYDNPAKLESIQLYEQETGRDAPHEISEMNHFWIQRSLTHILEHPVDWLSLMLRKAYYFLNTYEQYDNKTYGFHRQYYPLLNWNPIHWGMLLVLAVSGCLVGLHEQQSRRYMVAAIVIFAVYAAGTIAFYTSNRFRIPMLPILCILAAGNLHFVHAWRTSRGLWKGTLITCIALSCCITYSTWHQVNDTNTWTEDMALLANANLRIGDDAAAIDWAERALQRAPQRHDLRALIVQAHFNQWALATMPEELTRQRAHQLLNEALPVQNHHASVQTIVAIYYWKLGHTEQALGIWQQQRQESPTALMCLFGQETTQSPHRKKSAFTPNIKTTCCSNTPAMHG